MTIFQYFRQNQQTIFSSNGPKTLKPRINLMMVKAQFVLSCTSETYQSTLCNLPIGIRGCPLHHLPFIQQASNFLQTSRLAGKKSALRCRSWVLSAYWWHCSSGHCRFFPRSLAEALLNRNGERSWVKGIGAGLPGMT